MSTVRDLSSKFEPLVSHISKQTGFSFPASRLEDVAARIGRVMEQHHIECVDRLVRRLRADPYLLDAVIAEVAVGETYFFRDPGQFDAIRRIVLPALREDRPATSPLKIWSAGCSTGEEPYSIAILMEEEGLGDLVQITATDISKAALRTAEAAKYGEWSFRNDDAELLSRHFHRDGDNFRLNRRIRRLVRYEFLNLASNALPACENGTAAFDLILCRNVLIYLKADVVKHVAARFFNCLAPGGWLLIGASDPPLWRHAPFETTIAPAGVLYRRPKRQSNTRPAGQAWPTSPFDPPTPQPGGGAAQDCYGTPLEAKDGNLDHEPCPTDPPDDVDSWTLRIRSLADRGDTPAAGQVAAEAIKRHPLSPQLHYLQSLVFIAEDRLEESVAALRRVIYIDRTLAAAHLLLGSLLKNSEAGAARRAFQIAVALCAARPPDEIVPLTKGDTAGRLAEIARGQISALREKSAAKF